MISRDLLRLLLDEALTAPRRTLTRRDVRLPSVPGKAFAVIGVRRSGKTSFLRQCREDRIAAGRPEESQLLLQLEDERLAGMGVDDLGWVVEEHARRFPGIRPSGTLALYLDEVQTVAGWEGLVRRLIEQGGVEVFVSGSSAKLLSREVATSLRGRAMEVLVHPFSFREWLRHRGVEPAPAAGALAPDDRRRLAAAARDHLRDGGFPEVQRADPRDRAALLRGYVDIVVLRDVIERHAVSNPVALRRLVRELLANPGGQFSVQKHYDAMRSQGLAVAKDTVHAYLAHLEDAFLVRTIAMECVSERQRMVNPRKAYPVDPALIGLFERPGRENRGRALETAVLLELERRGAEITYVRTARDVECDFLADVPGQEPLLVQVCMDTADDPTWEREVRGLAAARAAVSGARALLVTLDDTPPARALPDGLEWSPAATWLLGVGAGGS